MACRKSPELRALGRRIIRDKFPWIREHGIRVGYCISDAEKKKGRDRYVFGECIKVQDTYTAWIPYDFIIVFYEQATDLLNDYQKEILMEHELMHIGLDPSGHLYIEQHDIDDFRPIIDRYGLDWCATD